MRNGVASSEHNGRADERRGGKSLANSFFSFPAAADVQRGGSRIRANAGHMDQAPDARFSRKPGDLCCGFDVNGMEGLWPSLGVQAHRIHDALDTRDGSRNGAIVSDVGLDRVEVNGGEKRRNAFRMPHCYPNGEITLKQALNDALAEKASPAKDGHLSWHHRSFLVMPS
jgi:hypothetical protein